MFWDWSTQGCQVPTTIVTAKKSSKKDEIDDKNDNNEDERGMALLLCFQFAYYESWF